MGIKGALLVLLIAGASYWYLTKGAGVTEEQYSTEIKDKIVVLCGASSGIGEEMAYQLAKKQAKLLLVARTESKLQRVKEKALQLGSPQVEILPFDFSDVENSKTVINKAVEVFGKLDYLVLNHASMTFGLFLEFPKHQQPSFVERIFKINIFSNIQLTLAALPHLEKSGGHIFVTSSLAGEIPALSAGLYTATKHALNGFFYSLQQELLAKQSNVGLTIGALIFIATNENQNVLGDAFKDIPSLFVGNAKDCAIGMMESLIVRPRTFTYPATAGRIMRAMWYFNPWYQEVIMKTMLKGSTYEAHKKETEDMHAKAAALDYQRGSF